MRHGDFVRQMPESARDFGPRVPLSERLRIDLPLAGILLLLSAYGLIVLYSASGRSLGTVIRQGTFIGLGFVMLIFLGALFFFGRGAPPA